MDNFNVSMYEYYLNHTERLGNASKALVFYGKYLSRQQFVSEVNIFANFLLSVGIKKGDNVLLCLGNIPNAIVCFYAINSIGAIVNVTHPLIAGNNLQQIATTMNSKAFIVFDEFCNKYQWLFSQEKPVVICSASDYLPIVAKQVYPLMIAKKTKCIRYSENIVKYRDIKKNSIKQKEKFVDKNVNDKENNVIDNIIDESNIVDDKNVINNKNIVDKENNNVVVGNDTAVFMHSGGTSGQPKTVEMSNEAFNHLVANMRAHIGGDLTDKDGMLMALPIFHTFGLGICMHTMLCLGGQCVLMPKFDGKKACHLIKKYNCTFISGVPNMYRKIVFCGKFKGKKIAKIKSCYCGGDKLSKDVFDKFAQQMKTVGRDLNISEGYGLTEACICAINKLDNFKFGSVGLAAQGSQFEVVDEARNFVGTNKVG
ncbi:MAG: AMP-binding protein, partial [Clostridia bacterium]